MLPLPLSLCLSFSYPRARSLSNCLPPTAAPPTDRRVKEALGVPNRLFREIAGGQERLRDRTGRLLEVEDLVLSAFSL